MTNETPKGLRVSIYKNSGRNCSSGGISQDYDEALVIGQNIPEIFEANDLPIIRLEANPFNSVKAVPIEIPTDMVGPMFGGCYVSTSDSRFTKAVENITGGRFYGAVALHDRFE